MRRGRRCRGWEALARVRKVRAFAGLAVALASVALLAASAAAQDADMLRGRLDADFEAGAAGWFATGGALTTEGGAGRVVATAAGPLVVSSEWWRVPTVPGAAHTLQLRVAADSRLSDVRTQLAFRAADGASLGTAGVDALVAPGDAFTLVSVRPLVSPADAAFAQITVRATAGTAGAVLRLDGVSLARDAATAPPLAAATAGADPPAPTPPPNATATSPTATPTPPRTATAAPRATTPPRASGTAAPTALLHEALYNGGFEAGLDGWTHAGGSLELTTGLDGAHAALLGSASDTTKWLQQAATVRGGEWYAAHARIKLGPRVATAWLRLVWYASVDASGAQLDIADSTPLTGEAGVTADVDIGPALAPADARSVRVRVLLRPAGADTATIVVDAIALAPATPPEATAPRPPAAAVRTALPERPLPEEAPVSAVRQAPSPRAPGST